MSMILLAVEDSDRDAPIRNLLTGEGWWVTTVGSKEEALRAAADHAPQLLIVDRRMDDPGALLRVFARASGGCGVLVLVDSLAEEPIGDVGDGLLARDQDEEAIVSRVRDSLDAPRTAQSAEGLARPEASAEQQLTTREIFGDILEDLAAKEPVADDDRLEGTEPEGVAGGEVPEPEGAVVADPEPEVEAEPELDLVVESEAGSEVEAWEPELEPDPEPEPEVDEVMGELEELAATLEDVEAPEPTTDLVDEMARLLESEQDAGEEGDALEGEDGSAAETTVAAIEPESAESAALTEGEAAGALLEIDESATDEIAEAYERVGPYELLELIELGDLTERWLARRAGGDGEPVVLERVRHELRHRADVRDAFVEGNTDAAGWDHPNVLSVIDLGRDEDVDFVVTEYRPGHALADVLERVRRMEARMPLGVSLLLVEKIAAALEVVADGAAGSRHGWLVPGAVWLTGDGEVLLREFSLGRLPAPDEALTRDWTELRFLAPERWSETGDIRSDLYSLGALFYEMVCGRPVRRVSEPEELTVAIRDEDTVAARQVDPTIPSEIDGWLMRLLRHDPDERPQSVPDVIAKVDLALQALPARPAGAELNAYVRQLFAARLPEPAAAPAATIEPVEDDTAPEEVAVEVTGRRWDWWWLLIPLLGLLSLFVGWKLMGTRTEVSGLDSRPQSRLVRTVSTAEPVMGVFPDSGLH